MILGLPRGPRCRAYSAPQTPSFALGYACIRLCCRFAVNVIAGSLLILNPRSQGSQGSQAEKNLLGHWLIIEVPRHDVWRILLGFSELSICLFSTFDKYKINWWNCEKTRNMVFELKIKHFLINDIFQKWHFQHFSSTIHSNFLVLPIWFPQKVQLQQSRAGHSSC